MSDFSRGPHKESGRRAGPVWTEKVPPVNARAVQIATLESQLLHTHNPQSVSLEGNTETSACACIPSS